MDARIEAPERSREALARIERLDPEFAVVAGGWRRSVHDTLGRKRWAELVAWRGELERRAKHQVRRRLGRP